MFSHLDFFEAFTGSKNPPAVVADISLPLKLVECNEVQELPCSLVESTDEK